MGIQVRLGAGDEEGASLMQDVNPLDCDLLVVDETSMVDVMLMQSLMKRAGDGAGAGG